LEKPRGLSRRISSFLTNQKKKRRVKMKKSWVKELENKELIKKLLWHAEYIGAAKEAKRKIPLYIRKRYEQLKKEALSRVNEHGKMFTIPLNFG
jgi:hypothetical protein